MVFLLDPWAIVDDFDFNLPVITNRPIIHAPNQYLAIFRRELNCVALIIQQYLLKPHLVGEDIKVVSKSLEDGFKVDFIKGNFVLLDLDHLLNCLPNVEFSDVLSKHFFVNLRQAEQIGYIKVQQFG